MSGLAFPKPVKREKPKRWMRRGIKPMADSASASQALAIPKGQSRADRKDERTQAGRVARDKCRREVWERDRGRCRRCDAAVRLYQRYDGDLTVMHGHEIVLRSLGGDDTDPANVVGLCAECHEWAHGPGASITVGLAGAHGPVQFDTITEVAS